MKKNILYLGVFILLIVLIYNIYLLYKPRKEVIYSEMLEYNTNIKTAEKVLGLFTIKDNETYNYQKQVLYSLLSKDLQDYYFNDINTEFNSNLPEINYTLKEISGTLNEVGIFKYKLRVEFKIDTNIVTKILIVKIENGKVTEIITL